MTKRILIIGGAGYVGAHVAKALARRGLQPVVFDDLSAGKREHVKWSPLIVGDVRDQRAVEDAIRQTGADAVMHFAARIEVGLGERDPATFYDVNVGGAASLLRAMRACGCERLVYSSTCAVYGAPVSLPLKETEPLKPANVYGRTKLAAERMIADFGAAYGLRWTALRYFNAAGADADGEIGEEHEPETHLIPLALKAAAGLSPPLHVFGNDYPTKDGSAIRDYVHVEDLADAHIRALELMDAAEGGRALNVGTGRGASVFDVIETIEAVTGRATPHEIAPRRAGDPPALYADPSLAAETLGFEARADLARIIETAWAYHAPRWGVA